MIIAAILGELKRKEYTLKLRRESTCLCSDEQQLTIMPEDFNVDESYLFEESNHPDLDRMLYAISLPLGVKGFLIDSCNVYRDNISEQLMQKLKPN